MTFDIFIIIIISMIIGILISICTVYIFNKLPVSWLTDYNESPDKKLTDKRIHLNPHGIVIAIIFFITAFLLLVINGFSLYYVVSCIVLWSLIIIAISDIKYMIIPDQFVILFTILAVISTINDLLFGHRIFHTFYLSPVFGCIAGGGIIYLIGLLGKILFRKNEAMGFGDVKLLFVAGLYFGYPKIFTILLMTVLISGVYFTLLIAAKKVQKDSNKALGPHIVIACSLYIIFYKQIDSLIEAYFNLLKI